MSRVHYKQIDLTQKDKEKLYLQKLQSQGYFIIGIEVFDKDISQLCHLNFDPQHSDGNYKNTALETVFNIKFDLKEIAYDFFDVLLITIKSDLDSISSIALINMVLKDKFELNGDLILRLKALSLSDRHGMDEDWKPNIKYDGFKLPNYTKYGIPISLVTLIGDINLNINYKIKIMMEYLINRVFENSEKYTNIAIDKLLKLKDSTTHKIIIPNKLIYVESTYRGAIGFGYKQAPVVIAKNSHYAFGKKINRYFGIKYTIAQYKENYIDIELIKEEITKREVGWGGSKVIIGSPQTKPSELSTNELIELVKKYGIT
jgi:hypothetical protein